ncbi:MAG: class I tRNA ligase family protein, partial [Patescibacteria group bacterium]
WNIYSFFVTYANLNEWKKVESKDVLDKWILERLNGLTSVVTESLNKFDAYTASRELENFVNDFSTWYIRRSRDRMTAEFFSTCYEVLVTLCKLLAPFTPFIAEEMYKNLTDEESVHLTDWPKSKKMTIDLIEQMQLVRTICEQGHAQRKLNNLKVRQPLQKIIIDKDLPLDLLQLIKDELNIKEVVKGDKIELDIKLTPELEAEGKARDLVRDIQDARKAAGTALDEKVVVELPEWPVEFETYIKEKTLAKELVKGEVLKIVR